MTEEPQLGSIQDRIAALKQSQAQPSGSPEASFLRPIAERSRSANNPPSYHVNGSVLDSASIGNEPADTRAQRSGPRPPPTPSPRPEVKPKPKVPPPLPTRKSNRLPPPSPPARPEVRPALPPRRPTEPSRRPSLESVKSDVSQSTVATTATTPSVGRGASSVSVNSIGSNSRIKAPAWGDAELPALPPRRVREDPVDLQPPPRSESKLGVGSLTSKISSLRGKVPSPAPSRPSLPSRPSARSDTSTSTSTSAAPPLPSRPPVRSDTSTSPAPQLPVRPPARAGTSPAPQLPPRRPSGQETQTNGTGDVPPSLPIRRLPPTSSAADLNNIRQSGFGGLNKSPGNPPRSSSTSTERPVSNGAPPPIPHSSRPDISKLQATKPRAQASALSATNATDCLVCRDFSGPDTHATRYPRESLPTQDLAWLANELTAPFPSLTDKARVIFTWLHHNIIYDTYSFFNHCVKPSTPASTLASGLAVCEGYAGLFAALATKAGLEAIVVGGHGKGIGHVDLAPGAPIPPFDGNHAWNAVRIDGGRWKLIDACWGAGHVEGWGMPYKQRFAPAMFSISNEEFGLKHFPANKEHFFREDGRTSITWEEYILTNPEMPSGRQPIKIYSDADKHSIGRRSLQPADGHLSVYGTPSPVRFQFGLICEHWTLAHHSHTKPGLFLLIIHGIDGRKDDRLPFTHVPGSGPGGGGEFWYVDVPDPRMLGAPGQKLLIAVLTKFGDREDCRGVTVEEYQAQVGRVGMAWAYIAEWELVQ
ncbi:uncharacterized protein N7459_004747 [Penicillium hispanicum]|uniref:uncharacterized protein n=1 Tax=Penicillium hispanicum TaxID=1080232 RepID=UPI002541AA4D|nr:uncharacterized protein N7459_004747 [Penicillium hispanicum]KAJ5584947.1 hypothetical protein N7459_004747 [Penicillium hispanicum]